MLHKLATYWQNKPWTQRLSLVGALAVIVGPFAALTLWNHPSADDFSYATYVVERGFWPNQVWYFLHWAGRYVANLVTSLTPIVFGAHQHTVTPLALTLYRIFSLVIIVLFCLSLWHLIRTFNRCFVQASLTSAIATYLLILTTILSTLASPAELFYWYPASVAYCLPFIALFWMVACWIRWANEPMRYMRRRLMIAMVIFALVQIGSQEMSLMVAVTTITVLVVLSYKSLKRQKQLRSLVWLLVPSVVAAVVAATAPGNFARKAIWVERGGSQPFAERFMSWSTDLVSTLWSSITQTRLLILLIVALPLLYITARELAQRFRARSPLWSAALLLIYWIGMSLPGLAASADELLGAGRTMNTYTIMLVVMLFIVVTHVIWFLLQRAPRLARLAKSFATSVTARFAWFVVVVVALGWVFASPQSNISVAWRNTLSGSAAHYDQQLLDRYQTLRSSTVGAVTLPHLTDVPATIFFDDITSDPLDWRNTSYARFFQKESVLLR